MNLSTQTMTYICAVATHLNFHKAAKACHTSQPNLSTQIKNIEKELGISIFERTNKFVRVTPTGKKVIETFRDILRQIDTLENLSKSKTYRELHIGLFPTLAPYLLPTLIATLKISLPHLKLTILEDKTEQLCEKLEKGDLDCILAAAPIKDDIFEHSIIFRDEFFVAIPIDHPLAQKTSLTLSDLQHEKVLLLEEGHCLRDQSLEICQNDALPIDFSYQSTSLETLKSMVAINAGITFVPKISIDSNPLLKYLPLKGTPYARRIALYWRKSSLKTETIISLINTLKGLQIYDTSSHA